MADKRKLTLKHPSQKLFYVETEAQAKAIKGKLGNKLKNMEINKIGLKKGAAEYAIDADPNHYLISGFLSDAEINGLIIGTHCQGVSRGEASGFIKTIDDCCPGSTTIPEVTVKTKFKKDAVDDGKSYEMTTFALDPTKLVVEGHKYNGNLRTYKLYRKNNTENIKYEKKEDLLRFDNVKAFSGDNAHSISSTKNDLCKIPPTSIEKPFSSFRVVSYNVHNWHKVCDDSNLGMTLENPPRKHPSHAINHIATNLPNPDVVLFQEYVPYTHHDSPFHTASGSVDVDFSSVDKMMDDKLSLPNSLKSNDFQNHHVPALKMFFMGKAMYTKDKYVVNTGYDMALELNPHKDRADRGCLRRLFKFGERLVWIYTVHLTFFARHETSFEIGNLREIMAIDQLITPYIIVMGDFNNQPEPEAGQAGDAIDIRVRGTAIANALEAEAAAAVSTANTVMSGVFAGMARTNKITMKLLNDIKIKTAFNQGDNAIDLIFVSEEFEKDFEILNEQTEPYHEANIGKYKVVNFSNASDHHPIYLDFRPKAIPAPTRP